MLTCVSASRDGDTTWKDKEKLSRKNRSCLGVVGYGGEVKAAQSQCVVVLEEQGKGKEMRAGCSG